MHLDGFDFDNDLGTPRLQKALGAWRGMFAGATSPSAPTDIEQRGRFGGNARQHPKRPPQPSLGLQRLWQPCPCHQLRRRDERHKGVRFFFPDLRYKVCCVKPGPGWGRRCQRPLPHRRAVQSRAVHASGPCSTPAHRRPRSARPAHGQPIFLSVIALAVAGGVMQCEVREPASS
jgi:hypothetical protein